jgi:hypothetical protein
LRFFIQGGQIEEARALIRQKFKTLYDINIRVRGYLDALWFIHLVASKQILEAITFSTNTLFQYTEPPFQISLPTKDNQGNHSEIPISEITALLCYEEPEKSDLKFLVTAEQSQIIADAINNEIISMSLHP